LKLFALHGTALACALYLAPRIGSQAAWTGVGLLMAPAAWALFWPQGRIIAGLVGLTSAALWTALWHAHFIWVVPGGISAMIVLFTFGQPALLTMTCVDGCCKARHI